MQENRKADFFAAIAASGIGNRGAGLVTPEPPLLQGETIRLDGIQDGAVFEPMHKIYTPEELKLELARSREEFAPFLQTWLRALKATGSVSA